MAEVERAKTGARTKKVRWERGEGENGREKWRPGDGKVELSSTFPGFTAPQAQ